MLNLERLAKVKARIAAAEQAANRKPGSVMLLAVSKTRPAQALVDIYKHGQRHIGENYLQEAFCKQLELSHYDISWHFIGPLQSNKTRVIAQQFSWVHSVDRLKIARRLSNQRPATLPKLNICIQVNISGEKSKSGAELSELKELAVAIAELPNLRLRGLMAIPAVQPNFDEQRIPFRAVRTELESLIKLGLPLDTLSMGMSQDMEAAITEGATIVRIGTDLFGPRISTV